MESQNLWYLENVDVLGIFCPKKMGHHEGDHFTKTYKKGEYIYVPDDKSNLIFFINSGRVKIGSYGKGGKEVTKAILQDGEVFGELSMIGQQKRQDFAEALEEVNVCGISVEQMKALFKDHNKLNLFFLKIIGSRVLEMENRLESLVFKDSRTRVVEFLVDLVKKRGERVGYEHVVRRFITHQDIANLTATSRQTVTTVLNELKSKNLLTFNRKRLLVRDLEALQAEA